MLSSFTIALLCGMALAVENIDDEVEFKNIYHMSGPSLLPNGYPGGEMLKAGGMIAWEKQGEGDTAELFMYQTVGVNIDQNYGKSESDDDNDDSETDTEQEKKDVSVVSPDEAVVQVGLCAPDTSAQTEDQHYMMCTLIEFQKDDEKILVKNWKVMGDTSFPDVSDMSKSLEELLLTNEEANEIIYNANYEIDTSEDDMKVTKADQDKDYKFGIVTKHVKADWNDMLKVTFYQKVNINEKQDYYNTVKDNGIIWQGRQYLAAFDQAKLEDNTPGAVQMAIGSVQYGVAKEGETIGTASWAQDTTIHSDKSDNDENDNDEKNAAGYLAASLGSFALALAVMNF